MQFNSELGFDFVNQHGEYLMIDDDVGCTT